MDKTKEKHTTYREPLVTDKTKEKHTTYAEAITELGELVGTQAPILQVESFRASLSVHGNPDDPLPPELQKTVDELKERTREASKK
jgi:hypothetical protein